MTNVVAVRPHSYIQQSCFSISLHPHICGGDLTESSMQNGVGVHVLVVHVLLAEDYGKRIRIY